MEALSVVQRRFYADYPPHPQEAVYGFASCTSMKPTQMGCAQQSGRADRTGVLWGVGRSGRFL